MDEKANIIPRLIVKEINGEASQEEIKIIQEWVRMSPCNKDLYERIRGKDFLASVIKSYDGIDDASAWDKIVRRIPGKDRQIRRVFLPLLKYAAAIAIPLLLAAYFLLQKPPATDPVFSFQFLESLMDDLEETTLVGANGEFINLAATSDSIISINGAHVSRRESELLYKDSIQDPPAATDRIYNTLVSPRGRVFNLVLADGTRVWLNASSAIKYPIQFDSTNREVFLFGEAFFEVASCSKKPFIVQTKDMQVEVLGTSFNLMAYPDDGFAEATLVTGQLKVKTAHHEVVIDPGTQARLHHESRQLEKLIVNTDLYTSWRDGKYIFERTSLETVMTKLARWYNYEVVYEKEHVKDFHFSGTLTRYHSIDRTLQIIELATGLKIEAVDRNVYISDV